MGTFRTTEIENKYEEYRKTPDFSEKCVLCDKEPLKSFRLWKIVENMFPYDKIAKTHHMIVPLRHITENELSQEELNEFKEIKNSTIHTDYGFIIEATHSKKTIPDHFYLHLIVAKT